MKTYSYWITFKKGLVSWVVFFVGAAIMSLMGEYSQYMDITLGALLIMILNWLKHKYQVKLL